MEIKSEKNEHGDKGKCLSLRTFRSDCSRREMGGVKRGIELVPFGRLPVSCPSLGSDVMEGYEPLESLPFIQSLAVGFQCILFGLFLPQECTWLLQVCAQMSPSC